MSVQQYRPGGCLSVAVVARDDDAVLAETLSDLWSWADEVVVLDTQSSDGTAEIAKSLGARVIAAPWRQDYAAARNHLFARLTGHWVLWLEPGERVAEGAWPELRRLVDTEADRDTAYALMVQIPPTEPSGSPEQAAIVRMIPNRPELQFEGRVGETVKPSIERAGLKIVLAPGRVLRHPRCHDVRWKSARARETLDLATLELPSGATRPIRVLLAMGDAASDLEDWPLARQVYSEAVRTAPCGSLEMLQGYYGILASFEGEPGGYPETGTGTLHLVQGRYPTHNIREPVPVSGQPFSDAQRQLAVCLEALEVFPLDMQLLCAMGTYLQAQNRLELAIRTFQTAIDYGQVHLEAWHLADIDQVAAVYLGLTLQLVGEYDRARAVLEQSLAHCPGSKRVRRQLIDLHIKHGRTEDAITAADGLDLDPPLREPLSNAVHGACLAARRQWTPALAYLQSAYLAGCEDPTCLRWLSVVLLSTGQVAAAEPVLRRWASVEPNNAELRAYLEAIRQRSDPQAAVHETPPSDTWYRIDPATTTIEVISRQVPIVSQVSSHEA